MFKGLFSTALFVSVVAASPAMASSMMTQTYSNLFGPDGGSARVNIHLSVPGPNNDVNSTVNAGGFRVTYDSQNLIAWCLDIMHYLTLPSPYSVTNQPYNNTSNVVDLVATGKQTAIENLFKTAYPAVQSDLTSDVFSGGFQLALWEILYEDSGTFQLSGAGKGSFSATADTGWWGATDQVAAAAILQGNAFLDNLNNPALQDYEFTYYQSDGYTGSSFWEWCKKYFSQNLVSVSPVAPVPLPAGGLLLGSGLLALFGFSRRKKKVAGTA